MKINEILKSASGKLMFVVSLFFIFIAALWLLGGTAQAGVKTAQESVEMSQADYDMSFRQAGDALVQHCEMWKALALSKINLAELVKLPTNLDPQQVDAVNCDNAKNVVPASF